MMCSSCLSRAHSGACEVLEPIRFRNNAERRAWVAFVTGGVNDPNLYRENCVLNADHMLRMYRERCLPAPTFDESTDGGG